jgi:choline dehydrogenase
VSHDTIIVGAGSAGCVLANRLSTDPQHRVLLLEAGPPDKKTEIHIPAAFSKLFRTEVDWAYETSPQASLDNRSLYWPRGRTLGGSSSINAMIYIRGHREIYDRWAARGNRGWSFEELLPYFKRSEDFADGPSEHHGSGGPLNVCGLRDPNPISRATVAAALGHGLAPNDDFNGASQSGVGFYHVTQKNGKRHSAAVAFLRPSLSRPNLTIETEAFVTRVICKDRRAIGVEYTQGGTTHTALAGEIVLSGGAINSPQLLMLSGIGPAPDLERHEIPVVSDLPGVGSNLQDHLLYVAAWVCTRPVSLANAESIGSLARYLLFKKGPLTSNVGEAGAFVRIDPTSAVPDLQYHFAPTWFVDHGQNNPEGHGLGLGPTLLCPQSRGSLRLASADPMAHPLIDPGYLSAEKDLATLVAGVRLAREIAAGGPLDDLRGEEFTPGQECQSDEEIAAAIRSTVETLYHPVGTCKMGGDGEAVVDDRLRVHGVDGLRVADASIMPIIPNGNTNAPTIMIGEKAADLVSS